MDDEVDRKAILARRARFIATAIAGLVGTVGAAAACDEVVVIEDGGGGSGGVPQPCLAPKPCLEVAEGGQGGTPQPCLGVSDGGAGGDISSGQGGKPQPCLAPPPSDPDP